MIGAVVCGACRCRFLSPDFPSAAGQRPACPLAKNRRRIPVSGPYRGRGMGGRRRTAARPPWLRLSARWAAALDHERHLPAGGGTRPPEPPACSPARRSAPRPCARTTHGPMPRAAWAAGGSTAGRQQDMGYGYYKLEKFSCFVNNNCNW